MNQALFLAIEIVLLAITGYFFWMTRKLAADTRRDLTTPLEPEQPPSTGPSHAEMARDVVSLLAQLQSAATAVRDDWSRQRTTMKEIIAQAQTAENTLRTLLEDLDARTEDLETAFQRAVTSTPAAVSVPVAVPAVLPAHPLVTNGNRPPALTIGIALEQFEQFLITNGRSDTTVNLMARHTREFAQWWGGQRFEIVPLTRIEPEEMDTYLAYLKAQNIQANTVKRKMGSLRAFAGWIDTILQPQPQNPDIPAATQPVVAIPPIVAAPSPLAITPDPFAPTVENRSLATGSQRRQLVLELANQGFDHRTIAAKTGLDQETVRMLLLVEMDHPGDHHV